MTFEFKHPITSYEWILEFEEYIENFLDKYRKSNQKYLPSKDSAEFLSQFDKYTLYEAKKYWNNYLCVEFWNNYKKHVDEYNKKHGTQLGIFDVELKNNESDFEIKPASYSILDNKKFRKKLFENTPYKKRSKLSFFRNNRREKKLYILFEKIYAVLFYQEKTVFKIIKNQLFQNQQLAICYGVVKFLDDYLFQNQENQTFSSPLKSIFLSNNSNQLSRYLEYAFLKNLKFQDISTVKNFLESQNKFSLKRALTTSYAENQIYNAYPRLLEYDKYENVVKIQHFPTELLDFYKKQQLSFGIPDSTGCPFAKSRGISKNTLLEHYEYFNQLFLGLLQESEEFKELFLE